MKPELLMPAGSMEKALYAAQYGADAIYLGTCDFSLRNMRKGDLITNENLKDAVDLIHSLNKRIYLTVNIFAYDEDLESLRQILPTIEEAAPDALIVSDFGVFNLIKKELPKLNLHISTQANSLNSETVKFWRDLGATRVILARELSLERIKKIRKNVRDVELECFVHGAQCVSYSGRCLLSDYMTDNERNANKGTCAQACRWSYALVEKTREGQYYPIEESEKGTHILSPKDLCLIKHIPELIDAGVDSFKVEGRTKSLYYVSAVAKAYRRAIDQTQNLDDLFVELQKVGNRGYCTGFFLGENKSDSYSYNISKGLAGADYLAFCMGLYEDGYKMKIKNKIYLNDALQLITPDNEVETKVVSIKDKNGVSLEVANTNDEVYMKFDNNLEDYKYMLARTIGVKAKDVCYT